MAGNQWAQTVRRQLGIGRVLPLGGPADGSWIAERAAVGVLRTAAGLPAGVRLGPLRLSLADPGQVAEPAVPAPPSALPPGPLRIEAEFAAVADRPLPVLADQVRTALLEAAFQQLGLVVGVVDLRVSELLEAGEGGPAAEPPGAAAPPEPPAHPGGTPGPAAEDSAGAPQDGAAGIAAAALGVSGVARLAPVLGGRSRPVRPADGHVLIELAVEAGYRALDVAHAVREAVAAAPPRPSTVAVLVTDVEPE
ncbi:hypothetical protein [Streptomyces lydicus]|uniref:hypothetical protein n=2 Tax=Streptomyces lydicus TaxID=47763 RepID=UPI0005262802|nr:hypothetical protein [Streptomyces lydicus]UEG90786.1 hypothetical protein LJ741_09710 [Streptomyces lydicus]